ncbi:Fur family transcriptional regulator [Neomegalonema perideroedes]|uniref:Fur family transcriptional regulator n=1 Tax=Neomegalonema perideroedes TaxID=217219 RepID=UPI00037BB7B9|nr:Fur family transcriptional regulator [Neomegalonema perideroedes]
MAAHARAHAHGAPDLTKNQALVLGALEKAEAPLSAYALLDQLRAEGLRAPLQIYRALEKLTALGLAHRLESLNAFVACAHRGGHGGHACPHDGAHRLMAFAICESCGGVEEFCEAAVEQGLKTWASSHGFRPAKTVLELRGLCARCPARPEAETTGA